MRFRFSKKFVVIAGMVLVLGVAFYGITRRNHSITITNANETAIIKKKSPPPVGPLAGLPCQYATSRPVAIMMPSDPEPRPLAGIGQADMVFEMNVTESGVTRMMAVFQCNHPGEIGSIRSAREDFIPLALGLHAILLHWGGEHKALELLDSHVIDNIDCLKLDGSTCLRKKNIPMPHNGYTTFALLLKKAAEYKYSLIDNSVTYPHAKGSSQGIVNPPSLYTGTSAVSWSYDAKTNLYSRTRAGTPEIDRGTAKQVTASNVITLNTTSTYVNILYNRVKTTGEGRAVTYQNGTEQIGTWKKEGQNGKLTIYDSSGQEVRLVPGSTWFEFVTE